MAPPQQDGSVTAAKSATEQPALLAVLQRAARA